MARAIWKYPFDIGDRVTIKLPRGAVVLHVECQGDVPCLWAMVDPTELASEQAFFVFGTGQPIPDDDYVYVATFTQGPFVWHMFQ